MTTDAIENEDDYLDKLYAQLREIILEGSSAVDAMRFQMEKLQLGPKNRASTMCHFRAAFGMHMKDLLYMTSWDFFEDQSISEEAINAKMTPILKDHALRIKSGELRLE